MEFCRKSTNVRLTKWKEASLYFVASASSAGKHICGDSVCLLIYFSCINVIRVLSAQSLSHEWQVARYEAWIVAEVMWFWGQQLASWWLEFKGNSVIQEPAAGPAASWLPSFLVTGKAAALLGQLLCGALGIISKAEAWSGSFSSHNDFVSILY